MLFIFSSMGANAQLGYWNNKGFVEMTPVESFVYKFVWPMDDESREAMRGLYDNMKETGNKSILKCTNFSGDVAWYVKKDCPLPEGKFFESDIYDTNSPALEEQYLVVLPQINCFVNWSGRVEDLLEYLGDQVTADYISEPDLSGGRTCRFISNLKTSKETLELGMRVHDLDMEGVKNFHSRVFYIDKIYESHLISVMMDSDENDVNLVYSMNWEGVSYPSGCYDPDDPWVTTDEGLAIDNPKMQEFAGSIWTLVNTGGFSLEENHNYVVRLTMKVPSDGKYMVALGNWFTSYSLEVPVSASDDFQIVDVPFLNYWGEKTDMPFKPIEEDAHINLCSGWVVGTTVVKKVEVYEIVGQGARSGETAIKTVKVANSDDAVYNLSGQRVDASYKGLVIQNGQKRIAR